MDISVTAYTSGIPWLLLSGFCFLSEKNLRFFCQCNAGFFLFILNLISIADLELYRAWGFRMDSSVLRYLANPTEAYASSSSSPLGFLLLLFGFLFLTTFWFYRWKVLSHLPTPSLPSWKNLISLLVGLVFLVVAARGGLQLTPLNSSFVYFSRDDFVNQATLNVGWNFFFSLAKLGNSYKNPYQYLPEEISKKLADNIFARSEPYHVPKLLREDRPNILLIIWESLTGNAVESLGGIKGVTPGFNHLASAGLLFSRIYSAGTRTCHGLPGILSGYPSQPFSPVIDFTKKAGRLPSIARELKKACYSTSFYYGGEIEYDNMKAYLNLAGFDRIVGKDSFKTELSDSKWGLHDHVVLNKTIADLEESPNPFFCTVLTLSSHEPFEVPITPVFPGDDTESKFKNALFYTDQAVFEFISKAKTKSWYKETLIIIIADHGIRIFGALPRYMPESYHIPMLWLGGALGSSGEIVSKIGSQNDLAKTLLEQLGMNAQDFRFSKDLLVSSTGSFAHMIFNDGFTWVTNKGFLSFDNAEKMSIYQSPEMTANDLKTAQAITQTEYQDFLDR